MEGNYSQVKAMLAITRASLKAMFKSPQATFFSLFFPIVLITIFGALGGNGGTASVDIAFAKDSDTTNRLYKEMQTARALSIAKGTEKDIQDRLRKGRITAIVSIHPIITDTVQGTEGYTAYPPLSAHAMYDLHLITTSASQRDLPLLQSVLKEMISRIDESVYKDRESYAVISQEMSEVRPYKMIDFFLPGMIGFSLIGAAVFGVAFAFYSLRDTLVLKRMYASPIRKAYIVLGESLARVIFQLFTVVVLLVFGTLFYHFTLAHGWLTFVDMLIMSFLALIVFMGFGFFFSGIAKNQNVIPIYANLFMFPQYFLSGTFFSKSALPEGLQSIIKFLPLTALNDAMRNIAFEGSSLWSCWREMGILAIWGILIYTIVTKTFRWE
ncbi:ABC-2 type transporter [Russula earlei]|uniref:ABC-2 type transporter n=1 Tax=Russula earlei TaxID=71964 RepID=A0ACC0TX66_9AGAM|nr:ABC-2 type transporter [Russula earlei]